MSDWLNDGVIEGDLLYAHPKGWWRRLWHWAMRRVFRRRRYGTFQIEGVTPTTITIKQDRD
jgi:hypothetical protein